MRVAIIGGGAAGFFAALSVREHHPRAKVEILEKTSKLLAKVKISGGGRCNVTHDCQYPSQLLKHYPRGKSILKKLFKIFDSQDTLKWFESKGVKLKTESDGRIFPVSDDSQSIIDCLLSACRKADISIKTKCDVISINEDSSEWKILSKNESSKYDKIIIATGGHPKLSSFDWLAEMGHQIVPPVPSLFTFNMPRESITELMGVVAPTVEVSIVGSKLSASGPLLITHWGMSGPAILPLSAWGARELYESNYQFDIMVNWQKEQNESEMTVLLENGGNTMLKNHNPTNLPSRLWLYLIDRAECHPERSWNDQTKKSKNKLIHTLFHDNYQVAGKTTFKEEFVTCGGVSLDSIDHNTLESKTCPGIFFAGEVLDIDGVTGGFNFQAAWTTGYVAGQLKSSMQ